jgi:hypothetical protein
MNFLVIDYYSLRLYKMWLQKVLRIINGIIILSVEVEVEVENQVFEKFQLSINENTLKKLLEQITHSRTQYLDLYDIKVS